MMDDEMKVKIGDCVLVDNAGTPVCLGTVVDPFPPAPPFPGTREAFKEHVVEVLEACVVGGDEKTRKLLIEKITPICVDFMRDGWDECYKYYVEFKTEEL